MDREQRIAQLERRITDISEEIAHLRNQPEEPKIGSIVYWRRTFGGGTWYDYAAIRATDGKWYVTGGKDCNQRITWDTLLGLTGSRALHLVCQMDTIKEGKAI